MNRVEKKFGVATVTRAGYCWFRFAYQLIFQSFDFNSSRGIVIQQFFGDVDRNSIEEMAIDVAKRNEETSRNSGALPANLSVNLFLAAHRKRRTRALQSGKLFACFRFIILLIQACNFRGSSISILLILYCWNVTKIVNHKLSSYLRNQL